MKLTVTSQPETIDWNATGLPGLIQRIRTVMTTRRGSVPLYRDFGVSWDAVDMPVGEALPLLVAEISGQIEKYVPEVRVRSVTFRQGREGALGGSIAAVAVVEIRKEYADDFR